MFRYSKAKRNCYRNSWYPLSRHLPLKFFDTGNFMKHRMVPLWNIWVLWNQKLSPKKRDTPPFLMHENFLYLNFFSNTEGFLYETLQNCETKSIRRNIVIAHLLFKKIFHTRNNLNHKGPPMILLGTSRQKNFDGKFWWPSPPSPPVISIFKIFRYPELLWNTEWFFYELFWNCETEKLRWKILIPLLLSIKFLVTGIFLKHRKLPLGNVSVLWDEKKSTENRDAPSSRFIPEIFRYQKFFGTLKDSFRKCFGSVRQKIVDRR